MSSLNRKAMHNHRIYRKAIALASTSSESGFSLIESLVAAAVVSILIVAIAPMVALSTSARINARRIDQATQAARSYIDAVRGGVIDVSGFPTTLISNNRDLQNSQTTYIFEDTVTPANSVAAPTSALLALDSPTAATPVRGIKIDVDGNGFSVDDPQDLVIQPMRSGGNDATVLSRQGFWLAVRVYRADALATGVTARIGSDPQCAQRGNTGFSTSSSVVCPLVTMRSQIMPTVNANNLDDIKLGIGN